MNSKVKLFFVLVAVSAVISVFSFFDVLGGVRSAKLTDATKPLLPIEQDADQDGLSNTDESYWNTDFQNPDTDGDGFLDGEEVASGFDPREASSNELGDKLEDTVYGSVKTVNAGDFEKTNFTDDTMGLLAGGMAAGDLKRDADPAKRETALSVLTDSAIDNFYKSLPEFSPELNVVGDSTSDQLNYLAALAKIVQRDLLNFTQKLDMNQNPFFQTDFFTQKASQVKTSRDNATSLNVPKNWVETHKKVIGLLNRFYLNYSAIAHYNDDAVKAVIAFNDIENLNSQGKQILKEIQDKIKSNALKPDDIVFSVLNILYKPE